MEQQQKKRGIVRRAAVGLAKGWAFSLGLTGLYQTGARIGRNVGGIGQQVYEGLTSKPSPRHDTFAEACVLYGYTDDFLFSQARKFQSRAVWWLVAALVALIWMGFAPWSDAPVSHFLLCAGGLFMSLTKSITNRFRVCQIRDQELYAFGSWARDSGRW